MYAPAFARSSPYDDGAVLVARHYGTPEAVSDCGDVVAANIDRGVHNGEDEDDSLAVVFSADTGAGRAHTPQRMNRTHTPQRWVLFSALLCSKIECVVIRVVRSALSMYHMI